MMRRSGPVQRNVKQDTTRVNTMIRVPEVRVIGPEGEQIGVMQTRDALAQAEEAGFDLVEVAPSAKPPVCRMMDYGRYRYEQQKKKRAQQKTTGGELKELRMRPSIEQHDFETKYRQAVEFLSEGNRLKLTVRFRGRELAHREIGREVLQRFVDELVEHGKIDGFIMDEGRNVTVSLVPVKGVGNPSKADA